jgi:hypothetical protein
MKQDLIQCPIDGNEYNKNFRCSDEPSCKNCSRKKPKKLKKHFKSPANKSKQKRLKKKTPPQPIQNIVQIIKPLYATGSPAMVSYFSQSGHLADIISFDPASINDYSSLIALTDTAKYLSLKINIEQDNNEILSTVRNIITKAKTDIGTNTGKGTRKGTMLQKTAKAIERRFWERFMRDGLTIKKTYENIAQEFNIEVENLERRYISPFRERIINDFQKIYPREKIKTWSRIRSLLKADN